MQPSLADGRDLLYSIIPKEVGPIENFEDEEDKNEGEWKPSMHLYDLI